MAPEMFVLKGEKSLSAEIEIVFTELLLQGEMKQPMRNTRRSIGPVPWRFFQLQKQSRFLQR